VDSLESASTTDVSILRPGTVQYFSSRRPFSSREGTNPILNYFGSGSSPWLVDDEHFMFATGAREAGRPAEPGASIRMTVKVKPV